MKSITINIGGGYKIRATYKVVGTFDVIAIGWEHPNYGYFADAMLWYRNLHIEKWMPIYVVNWSRKYKNVEDFRKNYPEFAPLFDLEKPMKRILKKALRQHLNKLSSSKKTS